MSGVRKTEVYRQGRADYDAGVDIEQCPYPIGDLRRTGWCTGWLDRRTWDRVGPILEKYGMSWP